MLLKVLKRMQSHVGLWFALLVSRAVKQHGHRVSHLGMESPVSTSTVDAYLGAWCYKIIAELPIPYTLPGHLCGSEKWKHHAKCCSDSRLEAEGYSGYVSEKPKSTPRLRATGYLLFCGEKTIAKYARSPFTPEAMHWLDRWLRTQRPNPGSYHSLPWGLATPSFHSKLLFWII